MIIKEECSICKSPVEEIIDLGLCPPANNFIEEKGQKVVVIEDLISTGGSSLKAVAALREADLDVKGLVAIFTYGFDIAHENFTKAECQYVTLSDYNSMITKALDNNLISQDELDSLKRWRDSPNDWNK